MCGNALQTLEYADVADAVSKHCKKAIDNSLNLDITELAARNIKPHLPEVVEEIRERVAQGEDPVQTTYEVIEAKRKPRKKPEPEKPADFPESDALRAQLADLKARQAGSKPKCHAHY